MRSTRSRILLALLGLGAALAVCVLAWSLARGSERLEDGAPRVRESAAPGRTALEATSPSVGERTPVSLVAETEEAGEPERPAVLVFLDQLEARPLAGSSWTLRGPASPGGDLRVRADDGGRCAVPAGAWTPISMEDPPWRVAEGPLELAPGEEVVVWVARPIEGIEVSVREPNGDVIPGAIVGWFPVTPIQDPNDSAWASDWHAGAEVEAVTDRIGVAELGPLAHPVGRIAVLASGYWPVQVPLQGQYPKGRVEVTLASLDPGEGRALELRLGDATGEAVSGVSVWTKYGTLLEVSDLAGWLKLPAWIGPRETLHLRSELTHPVSLRLADLNSDLVVLPERSTLSIEVTPASSGHVSLTPVKSALSPLIEMG